MVPLGRDDLNAERQSLWPGFRLGMVMRNDLFLAEPVDLTADPIEYPE
jgi:hypothetical protein